VRAAEAAAAVAEGRPTKPAKPSAGKRQDHLAEIAERLGDRLDTRVKISLGASKGTIVIDFATVGDLNRILAELGQDPFEGR
ncbi:chromosome partitioning protein ParB, partial [Schumannella luteola]